MRELPELKTPIDLEGELELQPPPNSYLAEEAIAIKFSS
jgi:hypothetical protein